MLSTYVDMVLYPVLKLMELLTDSRLTEHFGVSLLGIAVTVALISIVLNAIIYRVHANFGGVFTVKPKKTDQTQPVGRDTVRDGIEARRRAMDSANNRYR